MNPKLRFKDQCGNDFPDWEHKKIKDIGKVAMCRRIFKYQTLDFGEIPFFKIGTFGNTPDAYITRELFEEFKKKYPYPQNGNILISASGSIGKLVEYDGEDAYFQDSNIIWLEHEKDVLDAYLKQIYSILDWEEGLEGSTIKRLYNKVFLNKNINIPTISEQEKISKFLGDIDKKIEAQAILVEKLKNTKDAMLVKMFPQGDSKVPEIRFDGFSGDWEEKKIGEILKICHGKDYKHLSDGDIPVYGTGGIITYVNHYLCDWPCVCIGRKGTIDKTQYIDIPFWCVDTLFFSKPNTEQSPLFQYYLFHKINWNSYNAATGVPSLNGQIIEKIKIKVPRYEEQGKIGQFFANLDKEIEINQQKYDKLCDVKKALLSKLFPAKEEE